MAFTGLSKLVSTLRSGFCIISPQMRAWSGCPSSANQFYPWSSVIKATVNLPSCSTSTCLRHASSRSLTSAFPSCHHRKLSTRCSPYFLTSCRPLTSVRLESSLDLLCMKHQYTAQIPQHSSLSPTLTGKQHVRHKSSKSIKSKDSDSESESDTDTESDSEEEEELIDDDDDYEAPLNFKKVQIYLKSLRADSVVSSALDIARNRVGEIFYNSRLRLNGKKLLKKSKQLDVGDYVDVIVQRSTDDGQLLVKRVKIIEVLSERTNKDRLIATVKVWKNPFPVDDSYKLEGE